MPAVWWRLLTAISAIDSRLPYNWNWQRPWTEMAAFLESNPIILMDVGARGEAPPELHSLQAYVRRIGFEPDPEECRRLNDENQGVFFPNLLAESPGPRELHIYEEPGHSSVLTLSRRYQRFWSGDMPITSTLEKDAITLDDFLGQNPDLSPDLLKLDTQGTELAILQGGERALSGIGLVEVEAEFLPIYDNQPLFGDVAHFMGQRGFELLYLNRVFATRRQVYRGPSRGQVLFGDALFGRREDQLESLTPKQRAKYVILLCQYGHLDIAWQIFQDYGELEEQLPGLRDIFRGASNPLVRAALMQFDKLLALGLHLRRYNQRGTDADRVWPIR